MINRETMGTITTSTKLLQKHALQGTIRTMEQGQKVDIQGRVHALPSIYFQKSRTIKMGTKLNKEIKSYWGIGGI
jgi:hypothetical protein